MIDPEKTQVWLVGEGIASLAAATFLIRDAGVAGSHLGFNNPGHECRQQGIEKNLAGRHASNRTQEIFRWTSLEHIPSGARTKERMHA